MRRVFRAVNISFSDVRDETRRRRDEVTTSSTRRASDAAEVVAEHAPVVSAACEFGCNIGDIVGPVGLPGSCAGTGDIFNED